MMNYLHYTIALSFALAMPGFAGDAGVAENETIRLLDHFSNASEGLKAFSQAERIDSREINRKLVELLESDALATLHGDIGLLPVWYESLAILAERFPEAGISLPLAYDRGQATKFKNWWIKNESRIEYHDNAHRLVPATAPSASAEVSNEPPSTISVSTSAQPSPLPPAATAIQQPESAASPPSNRTESSPGGAILPGTEPPPSHADR